MKITLVAAVVIPHLDVVQIMSQLLRVPDTKVVLVRVYPLAAVQTELHLLLV